MIERIDVMESRDGRWERCVLYPISDPEFCSLLCYLLPTVLGV